MTLTSSCSSAFLSAISCSSALAWVSFSASCCWKQCSSCCVSSVLFLSSSLHLLSCCSSSFSSSSSCSLSSSWVGRFTLVKLFHFSRRDVSWFSCFCSSHSLQILFVFFTQNHQSLLAGLDKLQIIQMALDTSASSELVTSILYSKWVGGEFTILNMDEEFSLIHKEI